MLVFGAFPSPLPPLDLRRFGVARAPNVLDLRKFSRPKDTNWLDAWLEAPLTDRIADALLARVRAAPECMSVRLKVDDPADTGHVRDALGVTAWAQAAAGAGFVATLDVVCARWFGPEDIVPVHEADPWRHVDVLKVDDEEPGLWWLYTRGMRKFGRPDVSLRHVPERSLSVAVGLVERLIGVQAHGARIPDGGVVRLPGVPQGMRCHHSGSFGDPTFLNVHLELRWPGRDVR